MPGKLVNTNLEILKRDFPISHALLLHDELMTKVLIRHFGQIHALQTGLDVDGDSVTRWSTLYQTATGSPLLQAVLTLRKTALPDGLLETLLAGSRPFGGLLMEAGVLVRMTDRVIYRSGPPDGVYARSWGRRQRMLTAEGGRELCEVDECLVDETSLRRLLVAKGSS